MTVVGETAGLLTILSIEISGGRSMATCLCVCGNKTITRLARIKSGKCLSCGCLRGKAGTHGHAGGKKSSPTYSSWSSMRERCNNPKGWGWDHYGARGISVCERWSMFSNFLADMGERPSKNHTIDRIDPIGNYEPGNCRWATLKQQARNMTSNHLLTVGGITQPISAWAEEVGLEHYTISKRIRRGWSDELAVLTPNLGRGGRL